MQIFVNMFSYYSVISSHPIN